MNHKRKRPKNARSGCLMCKYWKINGTGKEQPDAGGSWKHRLNAGRDLNDYKKGKD